MYPGHDRTGPNPPVRPQMDNSVEASEALQDLIDILKQKYVSDCSYCAGTGMNLNKRPCERCHGRGKRRQFTKP